MKGADGKCAVHETTDGPRLPMLHGSCPTEVCIDCGMWRRTLHYKGAWQPADTLQTAVADEGGGYE
jgi:hypothetical protein